MNIWWKKIRWRGREGEVSLFCNFVKERSEPLDVTGVTAQGKGAPQLRCRGAARGLTPRRASHKPPELLETAGLKSGNTSISRPGPASETLGGNHDKVVKTRKGLTKCIFSIFIIKWQFFTKRIANTPVKIKSKTF